MQILPNGKSQFIDSAGQPLASGAVGFYFPGTLNPKPTFQDAAGTIANTNPIQLDSRGQAIIWGSGVYRQILKDASGVTIWDQITEDPNAGLTGSMTNARWIVGASYTDPVGSTPGTFVPGTTTTFNLPVAPGSIDNLWPFFDTGFQADNQISSLDDTTLVFTAPVPVGVQDVEIKIGSTIAIGTPGAGTVTDVNIAAGANINSSKLSYLPAGAGAVRVTVQDELRLTVYVKNFGAKGDGTTDDTAALAAVATYAAGLTNPCQIVFSPGTYCYTASPNWAVAGGKVSAQGNVVLRYKGTGNAVILDAGATAGVFIEDFTFGEQSNPFTIEAPQSSGHAIFARGLNTGTVVSAMVRGAGNASAGLLTNACVITTFHVQVVPYTTGWYDDGSGPAKPLAGTILTQRNAGEQTSYCTFINPQAAACQFGFSLDFALGNVFIGGDAEFNTITGMVLSANAVNNKVYGMDFEQNTVNDVACAGLYNEFICDTGSNGASGGFRFTGGAGNRLKGGTHDQVAVDAGTGNYIGEIVYQRGGSGSLQIVDNGTKTAFGRNWAAQQSKYTYGPSVITAVPVSPSPFTYTNSTGMPQQVSVTGGTVSVMAMFRGATQLGAFPTNSSVILSVGDSLSITFTVAPTIVASSLE